MPNLSWTFIDTSEPVFFVRRIILPSPYLLPKSHKKNIFKKSLEIFGMFQIVPIFVSDKTNVLTKTEKRIYPK